ncbi:MAG: histidine kinase [Acidobacteria bacterium]|nr:histidine kinase [Acidobacteriota bacterium]
MHPALRSTRGLLLALLAWLPLTAGLIGVYAAMTDAALEPAALLLGPALLVQLFLCLATWQICRTTSLEAPQIPVLVLKHLIAALVMEGFWLGLILLYSGLLDQLLPPPVWQQRFRDAFPLLLAMGLFLYFTATLAHYMLLALEKAQQARELALQQQILATRAELNSLQAVIHPHFLFNSLTALGALVRSQPAVAAEMTQQLAEFLRFSMRYSRQESVTVHEEVEHARRYLTLEQIRLGDRLQVEWQLDGTLEPRRIPPLILLPLVENAVKHGIQQCVAGGTVIIATRRTNDRLVMTVTNPREPEVPSPGGERLGLRTLQRRLKTRFGTAARLDIQAEEHQFRVSLQLPWVETRPEPVA